MTLLATVTETAAINWHSFFFLLFSLLTCGFALAVLLTNNIVRAAFYLILSLGATAGLFFVAGAVFVGAMQIMVYVGGTLILLLFGVMLTAKNRFVNMRTNSGEWIAAMVLGAALLLLLVYVAVNVKQPTTVAKGKPLPAVKAITKSIITETTDDQTVDIKEKEITPVGRLGLGLLSDYLLPFELISVHLLVVLVGAAYLARTIHKKKKPMGDKQ